MYECYNPHGNTRVVTDKMGEADFWALLGYIIVDYSRAF